LRLYIRSSASGIGINGIHLSNLDTQPELGVVSADALFYDEVPLLFSGMFVGIKNTTLDKGKIEVHPTVGFKAINYQFESTYQGLELVTVGYLSFLYLRHNTRRN